MRKLSPRTETADVTDQTVLSLPQAALGTKQSMEGWIRQESLEAGGREVVTRTSQTQRAQELDMCGGLGKEIREIISRSHCG